MAELLERLEAAICEPEGRGVVRHAYATEVGGESWGVVTNGHVLVAVQGANDAVPLQEAGLLDSSTQLVADLITQHEADGWIEGSLAEFCVWVGEVGAKVPESCDVCSGTGTVWCECHCGDDHTATCQDCDGKGISGGATPPRFGLIAGVLIDRNQLAKFVPLVGGETVRAAAGHAKGSIGGLNCLFLRGANWRATLMVVRTFDDNAPVDTPRWEPQPAPVSP